ncbi:ABC transporter ATP-binding protein [Solimonas aquatica]|nr:ABC transporter ATP-binding protein [Solimonas aquatica]
MNPQSSAPADARFVRIEQVGLTFQTRKARFEALREVNLDIARGEAVAVIGHSGCGKSTLLNLLAGLLMPTTGGVICGNKEVAGPGPERAVVFQSHSLLPWLSCFDNVYLAVEKVFGAQEKRAQLRARTEQALNRVGLSHAMHKRPGEISGGMKQRVGIARALAMEPKVLLMDEPFGALDALTRAALQDVTMQLHAQLGMTLMIITHDVDEAVLLADRVVMMSNGPAATIAQILDVDLPRPRDRLALAEDPRYHHCRAQILRFLQGHAQHD